MSKRECEHTTTTWRNYNGYRSLDAKYRHRQSCDLCGECPVPFGPARITPEVEIEIRAAELSRLGHAPLYDFYERVGWCDHRDDGYSGGLSGGGRPGCYLAGFLAREIITHGDNQ